MKEHFQRLAGRFDALGPRERGLLLAGVVLAVVFLFYLLAIEPGLMAKKRLRQQIAEAQQFSATLQQQLKAQGQDPAAVRRAERDALRKQLAEIDKTIGEVQRGLVPAERTAKLLEEVLRGGSGLQLVSLRTLPVKRFEPRGAGGEATSGANDPERQLYQHSFEITVQGSYADLHDYLRRVEKLPWRLFWTRISVSVLPEQPSKLSIILTVQTVSLSKAWLIV
jgi:MSHA biogenesis protein MshJ